MRLVFAHRGLNRVAPENTLAAFRAAAQAGARWIELDVDVIHDGTVIVCHDTLLDRTTDHSGSYYGMNAGEVAKIDAGSWFSPAFKGEPLPTFAQVVDLLNETGLNANVELKPCEAGAHMSQQLIEGVVRELSRLKPGIEIIVSSFSHVLLARFKEAAPQYPVGCLFEAATLGPDWRSVLEMVGAEYIHPEDASLTPERVQTIRQAGFGINVWTVNTRMRANQLFNWGVTGVFTDIADQMLDLEKP